MIHKVRHCQTEMEKTFKDPILKILNEGTEVVNGA